MQAHFPQFPQGTWVNLNSTLGIKIFFQRTTGSLKLSKEELWAVMADRRSIFFSIGQLINWLMRGAVFLRQIDLGPKVLEGPWPNKCFEWVRHMHFYLRSLMAHCHHLKKSHFCISVRICFQKKRWGMVWTWNIDTTYHTFMKIWSRQVVAVWKCPVSLSAFSLDFAAQHRAMLRLTLKLICPS